MQACHSLTLSHNKHKSLMELQNITEINLRVFLEAKDCRNFFLANRQCQPKVACKVLVNTTKIYRDVDKQSFFSKADLAGKVRHHTVVFVGHVM